MLRSRNICFAGLAAIISCGQTTHHSVKSDFGTAKKISIDRRHVFDLSGYADDSGGDPFNLFDENPSVDPRTETGADAYIPVTNPQPKRNPSIYFNGRSGSRIVADLQQGYKLTDVYLYDRSRGSDSIWIYTGTMKNWRLKAALESGAPGGNGWRKFSLDDSSRYVMIRFSSYETDVTEMVLYGTSGSNTPATTVTVQPNTFTKQTLDHFVGVNYIMETDAKWLKPFHYSRLYNYALDYDNDTNRSASNVKYNMLHYGYWNTGTHQYTFDIDALQKINDGNVWYSIRGVSGWMNAKGFGEHERPVNFPGMDPDDPASYSRHAEMMWHLSAFFGFEKVDTNLMSLSHEPRQSGRGLMHFYENGNEENAWWIGKDYCTPTAYFAQSSADFDGDEGRLGKRSGVANADHSSKLMMSGLIGLDTNRVRVYQFLTDNLRTDKKFPWQAGIQYHYYCGRDGKGISPEQDSLRWRLNKVRSFSKELQPDVPCFLGENGYDRNAASRQCTPYLTGHGAAQSQAIMLLRSMNATFFSGFDAYIIYWMRDMEGTNSPSVYMSSGLIYKDSSGKMQGYPAWYYLNSMISRLGNYRADSIVSEKGNVWVYKYRAVSDRHMVAYLIYAPTVNGTRIPAYTLHTGCKGIAEEITFEDKSETGVSRPVPLVKGDATIPVEEKPKLLLIRE